MAVQKLSQITAASSFGQLDTLVGVSGASADLRYSNKQIVDYAGAINVKDFGAKGDGVTDDTAAIQAALNAAFGTGTGTIVSTSQHHVIIPPGLYIVRGAGLTGKNWNGGRIDGSGRFTTIIQNADQGPVFTTNGCEYMSFQSMNLDGNNGTQVLFDLDWDGAGGTTALQSNTFFNMYFSDGGIGLRIANSNNMGSENLILNCFFDNCSSRGIGVVGFNALQQTMVGGNIQSCGIGINVIDGSFNVIDGVGFQVSGTYDIQIDGASNNTMVVIGCRTESPNFVKNAGGQNITILGCHQTSAGSRGIFYTGNGGQIHIAGSLFDGQVDPRQATRISIKDCQAYNEAVSGDWLVKSPTFWWFTPNNTQDLVIELENVLTNLAAGGAVDKEIGKQRIFTTDGSTVTTQNYTLLPIVPNYQAPTTGFATFLKSTDQNVIIDPAGTLAAGAIFLPPSPFIGQQVDIRFSQAITRLEIIPTDSLIAVGVPTSASIGTEITGVFYPPTNTWYCASGTSTRLGGGNLVLDSIGTFKNSGVASIATTGDAPAGSLIFAFVGASNGSPDTITALTDSAGNTYSLAAQSAGAGGYYNSSIWYCSNALHLPVGGTFTATTASAGTYVIAAGYALGYNGGVDKTTVVSNGSGTSASLASGTLGVANEIVVGTLYNQAASGGTFTEGAGFHTLSNHASFDLAWEIATSTGSVTWAPSWQVSYVFTAVLATFKAGA